jgi:hypothetical protein
VSNLDGLKKKIRSLLEVAKPGSGATEPERDTARRLAERLLAANGLTEKDIPEREIAIRRAVPPPAQYAMRPVFVVNIGGFGFGGAATNTSTGYSGFGNVFFTVED